MALPMWGWQKRRRRHSENSSRGSSLERMLDSLNQGELRVYKKASQKLNSIPRPPPPPPPPPVQILFHSIPFQRDERVPDPHQHGGRVSHHLCAGVRGAAGAQALQVRASHQPQPRQRGPGFHLRRASHRRARHRLFCCFQLCSHRQPRLAERGLVQLRAERERAAERRDILGWLETCASSLT